MELRERLVAFFREQDLMIEESDLQENRSLIRSGLLDSLALFNLALWVEREAGQPFDLTAVDLSRDWDTVATIVEFVDKLKHKQAGANAE